jgi:hypothetical protein
MKLVFNEGRFRGEVVRIDGNDVVIKTNDGVRLHRDNETIRPRQPGTSRMVLWLRLRPTTKTILVAVSPYRGARDGNALWRGVRRMRRRKLSTKSS